MSTPTDIDFDAAAWIRRWDDQQAGHVPDREAGFAFVFDLLARLDAAPGRLLDLGCGPGSLTARALERFPDAELVGIDVDPVMLELARRTIGERARWIDADLRGDDWVDALPTGGFDAVVSSTALHWLDADRLSALTAHVASLLRTGGVFINFDTLLADPSQPRLAELTTALRRERDAQRTGGDFEDFRSWWAAISELPSLSDLLAERERRFGERRTSAGTTVTQWQHALDSAGFAEVGILLQDLDRRVLVAIR